MSTPLRILIVEDEPTTVMAMKQELEQAGHTICGDAPDYRSAISLMKRELPDLAIIDIGLKGQPDGVVTAQALIQIKPIPLLYLTVHEDQETFIRAKQTNPIGFMNKPLRYSQLLKQVDLAWQNYYQGWNASDKPKADRVPTPDYLYLPDSYGEDLGDGQKRIHSKFRVHIDSIIWLQAKGSSTYLFITKDESDRLKKNTSALLVTINLGSLLDYLPDHFYRLSSSEAINLNHLDRIESRRIMLSGYSRAIEISEGSQQKLLERLTVARTRQRRKDG